MTDARGEVQDPVTTKTKFGVSGKNVRCLRIHIDSDIHTRGACALAS